LECLITTNEKSEQKGFKALDNFLNDKPQDKSTKVDDPFAELMVEQELNPKLSSLLDLKKPPPVLKQGKQAV